jgi:hypothetical protein
MRVEAARVLDFDSENRALSYLGGDFTTKELTGIAWSFGDPRHIEVRTLGFGETPVDVLRDFLAAYSEADIVTGHYIVGHDLPLINAMLLEYGHAPLSEKLVSDTKNHLLKRSGVSASQKNLAAYLDCPLPKVEMTDADWRESYRLTKTGRKLTEQRVAGDVRQHMWLREKLLELGWLGPAKLWRPGSGGTARYTP